MFKGGEMVESGTHEELLNKNGAYAEMFRVQGTDCTITFSTETIKYRLFSFHACMRRCWWDLISPWAPSECSSRFTWSALRTCS